MEVQDWAPQGRFGRPVGSVDPLWAPPALCFLLVIDMWALMMVPGVWVILRRFARVVGPWILVLDMWQRLICRASLPWIGDITDPWHFAWQPLIG